MHKPFSFYFLIILFVGLWFFPNYAEGQVDSLKRVWLNIAEEDSNRFSAIKSYYDQFMFAYPDSILAISHYHCHLAQNKKNRVELAEALDTRAFAYSVLGKYDSANYQLQEALVLIEQFNDSNRLARIYANIGVNYYNQDAFFEALQYYTRSLEIFEQEKSFSDQADVLNNIGLIYYEIKHFKLAKDFFNRALENYEAAALADKTGNIWLNIGAVYIDEKEYEKARRYINKALPIFQATNNKVSLADGHYLLAEVFQQMNRKESALIHLQKSDSLNRSIGSDIIYIGVHILWANLLLEEDVAKATQVGIELVEAVTQTTSNKLKKGVYKLLYRCYKKQNRFSEALQMHEKYKSYADSVLLDENEITLVREALQSEFEFKLLKKQLEHEQVQAQLKLRQVKERYAILLVFLVVIGAMFVFIRFRKLAHQKEKQAFLTQIEELKTSAQHVAHLHPNGFRLDRSKIEQAIDRNLNETDWKVLNLLLDDPVISNKSLAEQVFMSIDGVGSSLKRMYDFFQVKESRYKKISLIMEAMKISNQ